jgi:hypothetical protein
VEDLIALFPQLADERYERIGAWIMLVLFVLQLIAGGIEMLIPRLEKMAEETESKTDDDVVSVLRKIAGVLRLVNRWVPRLRGGKTALALFAFIPFLVACGAGALGEHAVVATVTHEIGEAGRETIMEVRGTALRDAALNARSANTSVADAVHEAGDAWDAEFGAVVEAYNTYAGAANAYTRGVYHEATGTLDEPVNLIALGRQVAEAWNAVARLLEDLGHPDLPVLPQWVLDYLQNL